MCSPTLHISALKLCLSMGPLLLLALRGAAGHSSPSVPSKQGSLPGQHTGLCPLCHTPGADPALQLAAFIDQPIYIGFNKYWLLFSSTPTHQWDTLFGLYYIVPFRCFFSSKSEVLGWQRSGIQVWLYLLQKPFCFVAWRWKLEACDVLLLN